MCCEAPLRLCVQSYMDLYPQDLKKNVLTCLRFFGVNRLGLSQSLRLQFKSQVIFWTTKCASLSTLLNAYEICGASKVYTCPIFYGGNQYLDAFVQLVSISAVTFTK